jgi:hypothetical protein
VCVELEGRPDEGERDCYADDGLHPSVEGHRRATHTFAGVLRRRLGIDIETATEEDEEQ